MYKTVSITKHTASGENITLYGIKSKKIYFPDLATNKEEIENLCKLCNSLNVDDTQILYIIEDFINSKSGLASEFPGR